MKQLRKFLGLINFYRKFILLCTQTLRILNNLLSAIKSSKKQIQWSAEAELAFSDIKAKLSNATLLVYPTPNAENTLFVDASATGFGAVLQQKVQIIWKPLSFFSHAFSPTQQRFGTFDRELLAIYLAVRHFRF